MRYFDFRVSSENQDTVYKILSGCLPHENFDIDLAKTALEELFRTVPMEETYGTTYMIFSVLKNMSALRMYMSGYTKTLRREIFENAVQAGVGTVIISEGFRAKDFFSEYGKTYNLDVPSDMFDATSFVYSEAMAVYDELFEMAIPTSECQSWLNVLRERLEYDITSKSISLAAQTLSTGVPVGKEIYRGAKDARSLMQFMVTDVNRRVTDMNADMSNRHIASPINSFDDSKIFDERNAFQIKELYNMGFEPIDGKYMVSTPDIITIVADEGVGKTRFAVDQAYKALMAGCRVLYICGETNKK